jgi:hypothetical protein
MECSTEELLGRPDYSSQGSKPVGVTRSSARGVGWYRNKNAIKSPGILSSVHASGVARSRSFRPLLTWFVRSPVYLFFGVQVGCSCPGSEGTHTGSLGLVCNVRCVWAACSTSLLSLFLTAKWNPWVHMALKLHSLKNLRYLYVY